ncbi:hypothetical protein [Alloactinosynnema sp. L-07]|uniref:hypothetical protein n=1 Tax=Alloactinosynnema sp. L-07 TaxID=1653480 RepID=UPI0012F93C92|nr:hypothetical protein [Alloactinosynnema sp. L-07]
MTGSRAALRRTAPGGSAPIMIGARLAAELGPSATVVVCEDTAELVIESTELSPAELVARLTALLTDHRFAAWELTRRQHGRQPADSSAIPDK